MKKQDSVRETLAHRNSMLLSYAEYRRLAICVVTVVFLFLSDLHSLMEVVSVSICNGKP